MKNTSITPRRDRGGWLGCSGLLSSHFLLLDAVELSSFFCAQTLKGVGGDLIILEEAAACEPKMVKEVVVPLLVVDTAVLICISTLKEADNSYSKMFEATKPDGSKMFEQMQIDLVWYRLSPLILLMRQACIDGCFNGCVCVCWQ
jgi:hypothetical protein